MSGGPKQPGEGELSVPSLPRQRGRRSIQFSDPTLSFPCTAPLSRASSPGKASSHQAKYGFFPV